MTSKFSLLFALVVGLSPLAAQAVGTSDGSSASTAAATPSPYEAAKADVDAGKYSTALPELLTLTKAEPKNADAWNLLGFTYRKLGKLDESSKAYLTVLKINPDHRGALEYQGELFIAQGAITKAKANLTKLTGLCGTCEEAEDLAKALQAAGA